MNSMKFQFTWLAVALLCGAHLCAQAVTPLAPQGDDEVLEVLPTITRNRPAPAQRAAHLPTASRPDPASAIRQARADIALARQTGETRHWGRAQAVLAPWWDHADAPPDLAVLQATVQQGRHEFEAARRVLEAALAREPGHAQGWLNLAALERLSARYAQSWVACDAVARAGQAFYAQACRFETVSLQGRHDEAVSGLQRLIAHATDVGQRSWLWSLLAECRERAGQDSAAALAYRTSLALEADLYTAIAHADLLLRQGDATNALATLATLPETDAVLIRRGAAWRRQGDSRWTGVSAVLAERNAELRRRGDDPTLHGRELALAALWLTDDAKQALALARQNLLLQREPFDWWLALQSALRARDSAAVADISAQIRVAGLRDARLGIAAPATTTRSAGRTREAT